MRNETRFRVPIGYALESNKMWKQVKVQMLNTFFYAVYILSNIDLYGISSFLSVIADLNFFLYFVRSSTTIVKKV